VVIEPPTSLGLLGEVVELAVEARVDERPVALELELQGHVGAGDPHQVEAELSRFSLDTQGKLDRASQRVRLRRSGRLDVARTAARVDLGR
jgi:hypothetical protein